MTEILAVATDTDSFLVIFLIVLAIIALLLFILRR